MKTNALPAFMALSACVAGSQEDCGSVVLPNGDGVVALARNGQPIALANYPDNIFPIEGDFELTDDNLLTVDLWGLTDFQVKGKRPSGSSAEASFPLTYAGFDTQIEPGVTSDNLVDYELGADGGTLRLTGIVPQEGGYRIRGSFTANLCPSRVADQNKPCISLSGNFAFDEESLPEGFNPGTLLQALAVNG
jgi:hypothetical protein